LNYKFELDINELDEVLTKLKDLIYNKNKIILLRGDIAIGKTTLVKAYMKYINIKDDVTSPTFCIQNIYSNNIFHYDIYNKTLEEFINLGLLEEFDKNGLHFVEWANDELEKIIKNYGFEFINIYIKKSNNKRIYEIYE
jgi:tRNA threonylcarbamoyladenosine biosynthesis protein TsaE